MKFLFGIILGLVVAWGAWLFLAGGDDNPVADRLRDVVLPLEASDIDRITTRSETTSELFGDYMVHVYCSFKNEGRSRMITAESEVTAQNGMFKKTQEQYIGQGQTADFHFTFSEVDYSLLGDNSFRYNCYMKSQREA